MLGDVLGKAILRKVMRVESVWQKNKRVKYSNIRSGANRWQTATNNGNNHQNEPSWCRVRRGQGWDQHNVRKMKKSYGRATEGEAGGGGFMLDEAKTCATGEVQRRTTIKQTVKLRTSKIRKRQRQAGGFIFEIQIEYCQRWISKVPWYRIKHTDIKKYFFLNFKSGTLTKTPSCCLVFMIRVWRIKVGPRSLFCRGEK